MNASLPRGNRELSGGGGKRKEGISQESTVYVSKEAWRERERAMRYRRPLHSSGAEMMRRKQEIGGRGKGSNVRRGAHWRRSKAREKNVNSQVW